MGSKTFAAPVENPEAEDTVFSLSPQSALFGELSYVLAKKFAF